jgi:adenylate kinase family enzyme
VRNYEYYANGFTLGCPGSGKGTLCQRLSHEFGFYYLSVGDLMREILQQKKVNDSEVDHCVRTGSLVPVKNLAPILEVHLATKKTLAIESFSSMASPGKQSR